MAELSLVFRSAGHLCAVGLTDVVEIMRPQPVTALAGAPAFVSGVAIIRATPTPVVSLAALLDGHEDGHEDRHEDGHESDSGGEGRSARFVTAWESGRLVAFAVDEVLGVLPLPRDALDRTSPLLGALSRDVIAVMAALDAEPLCMLGHVRLVPDPVWAAVDLERAG